VAGRVGVTPLQVNEVFPITPCCTASRCGKYHVQVCTNISCLLRDGDKLWEHACKKLGIGNKEVTEDGADFARGSGVHGRLLVGAGGPGQLRFPSRRDARETGPSFWTA
jgi:hypothetical protein